MQGHLVGARNLNRSSTVASAGVMTARLAVERDDQSAVQRNTHSSGGAGQRGSTNGARPAVAIGCHSSAS
jgi:hypothetical protein